MKLTIVYKEASDHAREVRNYLYDFEIQTGRTLEVMDPYSIEGSEFCRNHDIVEYPTIVATADDGAMLNMWRGTPLPLIDEVSYYAS